MKHNISRKFYPVILIVLMSSAFPLSAESSKPIALVVKTSGISHLLRGSKRTPVKINDFVMPEDRIQTNKNATVNLQFSSGVIFMIGSTSSDSDVKIKKFEKTDDSQEIGLELIKGSLAASSEKLAKKDSISVTTPTAIAGVRGTEFIVDADEDSTEVLVNEGSVAVSDVNEEKEVIVEPGNKVIADTKGLQLAILEQFEKQRFEMIKSLEDSRQKNMEALINQIERDRKTLEGVKNPFDK